LRWSTPMGERMIRDLDDRPFCPVREGWVGQ
jgi:hypothetical protein